MDTGGFVRVIVIVIAMIVREKEKWTKVKSYKWWSSQ